MNAYNPITGATIEISEYGFQMLQLKGWVRATDQTPMSQGVPTKVSPPIVVDMKAELEKKRQEIAERKAAELQNIEGSTKDILGKEVFEKLPPADNKVKTSKPKTKPKAVPGKEVKGKQTNKKVK